MNHLKTAHRILRSCLTPIVGGLSLLTIAGCGVFSEEPVSAPTATPRAIAPAATTPTQAPTEQAPSSVSIDTDFYRAVWTGDADRVRQLVDAGANVNAIDQDGNPFLQQAVWRDHVAVAWVLIDAGADVNAKDSEDNPLLHEAIWRGHVEVARVLVDAGADVNAKDTDGNPLLREAIWRGHTEVARVLVDAGADVDTKDSDGNPLLYSAIWRDHREITQILADAGADVDARDSDNDPLMYTAVWRENTEVLKILIAAGADVNSRRPNGESLLYVARWRDHAEIERILLEAGADVNAVSSGGDPLQLDTTPISTHALAPGDVLTFKHDFIGIHLELEALEVVRGYPGDGRDFSLDSGNVWVKVVIEVKNLGEDEYSQFRSFGFALVDANYSELGDAFGAPDTGNLIEDKKLAPGDTVRGDVVLQAPFSETFLALSVDPRFSDAQYLLLTAGSRAVALPAPTPTPTATPEPTATPAPPRTPPYVAVVDRSSSSLTLSVGIYDATYYEVRRRAATAPVEWTDLGRQDSGTFNDHGLDPDATYYYSAKRCNSVGCSGYSDEIGGVTEAAGQVDVPSIPTGVRGMKVNVTFGTDDARVTWSAAQGATYYEVYQGSDFDAEISAPQTRYYDGSPNTRVLVGFVPTSYKVRACNKAGCSAFSGTVTVY